jgi:acyl-CoA synthetase (AMP-forming)/AMP-acid ligase II
VRDRGATMSHTASTWVEVLRHRAQLQPDRIAFTWLGDDAANDLPITYQALDERARAIGGLLQLQGQPGDRALLLVPPGLDFIAALFGCFYAGWVAVPAYPPPLNQRLDRIHSIVGDAEPTIALTTNATLVRIRSGVAANEKLRDLRWCAIDVDLGDQSNPVEPAVLTGDSLAVLQYTSGTTATPRGVMLSHANLLHNARQIQVRFQADHTSQGVIWLPPYHDMGLVGGILEGVLAGFPIALMPPVAFLQKPARWLEAISRTRATISGGPNFAFDLCVDRIPHAEREGLDLSSWRVAFNGSEPVRPATLERFGDAFAANGFNRVAFYPCYGLAEATLMVSGGSAAAPPVVLQLEDHRSATGCGTSIDDQQIEIVDGEIWVAGPSVSSGYWRQADLNTEVFGNYLANGDGPFLRTGDLGFLRDDELFVTGRLKSVLILSGRKIQAEDLEASLGQSSVAFSMDRDEQERLVIVHEVVKGHPPEEYLALANHIRLRIAEEHQLPVSQVVLTRSRGIPRTSSGKLQRARCRDLYEAGELPILYEWP